MKLYSYFMNTIEPAQGFAFGQMRVESTGVPGKFRFCNGIASTISVFPYVAYVNGVRTTGFVPAVGGCTPDFTVGSTGDFQLSVRSTQIFGVNAGGANEYNLFGISQLACDVEVTICSSRIG